MMIVKAGEKIVCDGPDQHECGEVLIDIDSDQIITMPTSGSGKQRPFSISWDAIANAKGESEYICPCGKVVARVHNATYELHTRHGWAGKLA